MDPEKEEKSVTNLNKMKLISEVKDLLEFYFSPANLAKDKFIQNLLEKASDIPLDTFFQFNAIKSLTDDIKILRKAIKESNILTLSQGGVCVKKAPLIMKENDIDGPIFVENLPPKSESRHRKKKLISEVKDMLEFYFSPANLAKDKFMQNLLEKDPDIPLNTFFQFNAIKSLTHDMKILGKAIKESDLLSLSQDGACVKRIAPLIMKENDTDCTIYVENLPPNSSHEWLRKVFSIYGIIDYISLPRFQKSGRPKGFSFIEFSTPQEAEKALESFGGLASLDGTLNPSELLTIKTYGQLDGTIDSQLQPSSVKDNFNEKESTNKRSATEAFTEDHFESEAPSVKKMKQSEDKQNEPKKVKKKKRKRRTKKEREFEPDSVYLRVMSKRNWKRLRNEYLNYQKQNMKQLKHSRYDSFCSEENSFTYKESSRTSHNSFYSQENHNVETCEEKEKKKSFKPEFAPSVIAKITLQEPPQNPTEFRKDLTENRPAICYIDVSSENLNVYVRFKCAADCTHFISEGLFNNTILLEGKEEKAYWESIFSAWEGKRNKRKPLCSSQLTLKRGKDKLCQKALKKNELSHQHILFDD